MAIDSIRGRTQSVPGLNPNTKAEVNNEKIDFIKAPEKNDSVAITTMAQDIKNAFETSSSTAIVDADKVAAVKQALADGSYQIDAEKIAEQIIQYEKLMPK